ncbi:MAG: ABC transporter ATP-binding protein [Kiritimatiellae bacterium]|nr:ABC transporter ATP-binding protein [Kiritimatiellia bacterium]
MTHVVTMQDVAAGYRGKPVLAGIALSIAEGDMVGLLGPNGAGKTTLLRALTGLTPLLGGTIRLFGRDIAGMRPPDRARLVAVIPQEFATPMSFSVQDIVMIGRTAALPRWSRPARDDYRIVERAMAYTDVTDLRDRPLQELSGGEKQRAVVAMALAQEPRLILMDEATSHLDINHRLEIMQIVERLNTEQGVTVVMTSHDLNLAAEFCRRLVLLDHGRLVADGTPAEVLTEDGLRRVYHCDIRVHRDAASGVVNVAPARRLTPRRRTPGPRVHVVAGGGSAGELIRRLNLYGFRISCGVLNQGDTDEQVASALGCPLALEKPFSPVGPESLAQAAELAAEAEAIVLSDVPFGSGNVANLEIAERAIEQGRPVLILGPDIAARDYTAEGEARRRVEALVKKGARLFESVAELLAALPGGAAGS